MYASWLAPGRNHLYWGAEVRGPHIVDLAEVLMVFHGSFSECPLWGVMPIIAKFDELLTIHSLISPGYVHVMPAIIFVIETVE